MKNSIEETSVDRPLTIRQVTSDGKVISDGGQATSPMVFFSLTGPSDKILRLFEDGNPRVSMQADLNGLAGRLITDIQEGAHTYKAEFMDEYSAEFRMTLIASAAPLIGLLKDSVKEIPDNGSTTEMVLDIEGDARQGEVLIYDDTETNLVGRALAGTDGKWKDVLNLPTRKTYQLIAKDVAGRTSPTYTITVNSLPGGEPRISSLKDGSDTEVPNEGGTSNETLQIEGTASSDKVYIYDGHGATPIDEFTVVDGKWNGSLSLNNNKRYSLTAKIDGGGTSAAKVFFVGALQNPQITKISERGGKELNDGDKTDINRLDIQGVAFGHYRLMLRNNETPLVPTSVDITDTWLIGTDLLSDGIYEFNAQPTPSAGGNPSETFTVTIDTAATSKSPIKHD
ncbi:hypothetical protein [Pseudomonas sp. SWRI99]|uniref:hypothetical protein n=1 Tax=Pseudomonas sp. SWRI99 TaxID=2745506 RepID=UPI0016452C44|nr:hypothetical protein [Pseudomonas sp. SWRI99]MBC3778552.1 hypothetical protein [Pseudomonas sp. SWRI99]